MILGGVSLALDVAITATLLVDGTTEPPLSECVACTPKPGRLDRGLLMFSEWN